MLKSEVSRSRKQCTRPTYALKSGGKRSKYSKGLCQAQCGDVDIPYPFGVGAGCYIDDWFAIDCNNQSAVASSPKPFLKSFKLEVLNISLQHGTVRVNYPIFSTCANGTKTEASVDLASSPFVFSQFANKFLAVGCDNFASLTSPNGTTVGGCSSTAASALSCNGTNYCQTSIPSNFQLFNATIESINNESQSTIDCKYAFLAEQMWFQVNLINPFEIQNMSQVPVAFDWGLNTTLFPLVTGNNQSSSDNSSSYTCSNKSSTFTCLCKSGFEGNPYLPQGCTNINECIGSNMCLGDWNNSSSGWNDSSSAWNNSSRSLCVNTYGSYYCLAVIEPRPPPTKTITIGISTSLGFVFLLIGGWWSYKVVKKRNKIKRKEKFFKLNGGLLLQQQLSSSEVDVEKTKLFNSKELEKATDHFNVNRILGQRGQGTVYKGMLVDGRIVAVKKSKVIDEARLEEFINEVVILSQINHRNVVKLLGCCLETEVPLLVYEFIPNGTLSHYLDGQNEEFPPTWDMHLQIANEAARALFYLHSVASSPIYHRDIKTTNILLDDKYRAKIAYFGTSRSITIDQTHLTTVVQGTFGYLDPKYFQSSQFTEKSDVYSFGVVLTELLTREKAISSTRTQENKSLATYFIHSMEENNLFNIIDARVMKDAKKDEIIAVANLAKMCLNLSGKKRPTMKEVATKLEAIQTLRKAPNVQQNCEEVEYVTVEMYEQWDAISTSTMLSSSDSRPLLSF
ncbi:hypothetical protein ACJW30_11G033000 [Castanea mollissima]